MIRLARIIGFRLSFKEEEEYLALRTRLHLWSWTDLVRRALRELLDKHPRQASDNGVKQPIGRLTPGPLFDKKGKKPAKVKGKPQKKRGKRVA
jgi:hypothetical protein